MRQPRGSSADEYYWPTKAPVIPNYKPNNENPRSLIWPKNQRELLTLELLPCYHPGSPSDSLMAGDADRVHTCAAFMELVFVESLSNCVDLFRFYIEKGGFFETPSFTARDVLKRE